MIPLLFGAALVLFFSPKSRENCRHPVPEPPSPDTKVRYILPHLSTSTACLTLPAFGDGHVQSPAGPAWLHLVQAHKQRLFCLSRLIPEIFGAWWDPTVVGLRQGKYTWRLLWRGLLFCPSLPALHALHEHEEGADRDRVIAAESLEMNSLLRYYLWFRAQRLDGVGLRVVFGRRGVQNRSGQGNGVIYVTGSAVWFLIV